jgi:proteasome lid subunit RPN8/RPN11
LKANVVLSDRAYIAILTETFGKLETETGGVFLGHYKNGIWYVIESIDPGPKSVFSPVQFEYDQKYINHIINKINTLYKDPLQLIGLWHRHPGSMDTFSSTDDKTNAMYAKINTYGAISALVNIDPKLRITVYSVSLQPRMYGHLEYTFGNKHIPDELLAYVPANELEYKINSASGRKGQKTGKKGLFKEIVHKAFNEHYSKNSIPRQHIAPLSDDDIEKVIEVLEDDTDYFAKAGIHCTMSITKDKMLRLSETDQNGTIREYADFFMDNGRVYVYYDRRFCLYKQGLFKSTTAKLER